MTLPRPALVASLAPQHPPDYPDVDRRTCQLMGPTALVVQALMGMGVIATLLYKRQREKPQRKWRVWLFDVSKQILGQIAVHFSNIGISDWISHISVKNPCVTYFLNVLVDATIGTYVCFTALSGGISWKAACGDTRGAHVLRLGWLTFCNLIRALNLQESA